MRAISALISARSRHDLGAIFADLRCIDHYFPAPVAWLHIGFDCKTFTNLATDTHGRAKSNSYMGTSQEVGPRSSLRLHLT